MRLLIVFIVGLMPAFFVILYANRKAKKRKLQQNALLEKNAELLGCGELVAEHGIVVIGPGVGKCLAYLLNILLVPFEKLV